jgi:hypothetical protein
MGGGGGRGAGQQSNGATWATPCPAAARGPLTPSWRQACACAVLGVGDGAAREGGICTTPLQRAQSCTCPAAHLHPAVVHSWVRATGALGLGCSAPLQAWRRCALCWAACAGLPPPERAGQTAVLASKQCRGRSTRLPRGAVRALCEGPRAVQEGCPHSSTCQRHSGGAHQALRPPRPRPPRMSPMPLAPCPAPPPCRPGSGRGTTPPAQALARQSNAAHARVLCHTWLAMQCSKPIMANAEMGSQMATALPVRSWAAFACHVAILQAGAHTRSTAPHPQQPWLAACLVTPR